MSQLAPPFNSAGRALLFVSLAFLFQLPFTGAAALRTILLLACLSLTLWMWFKTRPMRPPLLWAFALWAIAALLATLAAESPAESFKHLKSEVAYSLIIYCAFFMASAQANAFVLFRRVAALSLAILGGGAVIASLFAGGKWVDGYYNQLGEYNTFVITTLPLVLTALLPSPVRAGTKERWLTMLSIVIALLACFLSKSRGVWIAVTLIAVVMPLYAWRHVGKKYRLEASLLVCLIAGTGLVAAFYAGSLRGMALVQSNAREVIYAAAIEHILEKPLFGYGLGRTSSQAYYETVTPQKGLIEHPHNLFLSYADQAGLIGLLALLCILGAFLLYFAKAVRTKQSSIFAVTGLTLLVAVVLRSMPDMFFYGQNLWLFWAHCGILTHCVLFPPATPFGIPSRAG